jgi:hypothetical protein
VNNVAQGAGFQSPESNIGMYFAESKIPAQSPSVSLSEAFQIYSVESSNEDKDDDRMNSSSHTNNEFSGVQIDASATYNNSFVVNPKPFIVGNKTYHAIFVYHLSHAYNEASVEAMISGDGKSCDVSFTTPT